MFFQFFSIYLFSQAGFIENIRMKVDTLTYDLQGNTITYSGEPHLFFQYNDDEEVAEVFLYYDPGNRPDIEILFSNDYSIVDSLIYLQGLARFKVRFNSLTESQFLKFSFYVTLDSVVALEEFNLLPVYNSQVDVYAASNELFIGEEKIIELVTNNPGNLILDTRWTENESINYRFSERGGSAVIHLLPNIAGLHQLDASIHLKKPYLDDEGNLQFQIPVDTEFLVKQGRLAFLAFDQQEVTPREDKREPVSIQIENHRLLQIGKTYRIENQEEIGGPLIAELFTKSRLTNNRVLCELRVYAFHRKSEGYLYLKDGDLARFITNLDITPKTEIASIFIEREGRDWQKSNIVYPGERINVRLEGKGMHKAQISFQGAKDLEIDSLVRNERLSLFEIHIPENISVRNIEIYNFNEQTGKSLAVREYQKPREFDFITLDLDGEKYEVSELNRPIYYEKSLADLLIDFDRDMIDRDGEMYGVQLLDIQFKIFNKAGNLIEIYKLSEFGVCPSGDSPRAHYYDNSNCNPEDININNYVNKKTYNLEEWSKIEIDISHSRQRYNAAGFHKKINIYLKRDYNFDIDVSFPAGLLILKFGSGGDFDNFSKGISFAMMAQFSFYQEGKIAKYKPFKVGAGFIAIDALNYSESSGNRDVGLVVIGSVYPISSNRKLTFPLYSGFGYLLSEQKAFFLVGPGIRVRF